MSDEENLLKDMVATCIGLIEAKKIFDAEHILRQALSIDSCFAPAWTQLGNCLLLMKREWEAEEAYREALKHNEQDWGTWLLLARLLANQDRSSDCLGACEEVIKYNPGNQEAIFLMIYSGARERESGRSTSTVTDTILEDALSDEPVLWDMTDTKEAQGIIRKIIQQSISSGEEVSLGYICNQTGLDSQAAEMVISVEAINQNCSCEFQDSKNTSDDVQIRFVQK
ncbi:MAG: hypothetical protein RTV41_08730 [Candidatus Thorarchaeota archaeon]